jgi:hypothetical protein
MKKLLIGAAVVAMLISSTVAKADNDWIGPVIIGTVFGVIIANSNKFGDHHFVRRHHPRQGWRYRDRPLYEWVEVCKHYPYVRRNLHGHYYQVPRFECRMVKKARW